MSVLPAAVLDTMSMLVRQLPSSTLAVVVSELAQCADVAQAKELLARSGSTVSSAGRFALSELLKAWAESGLPFEGRQIACALQAMAWEDHAARARLAVELVWTGPALAGHGFRSTEQRVVELVDLATKSVWIVAFAAYRVPSIVAALERAVVRDVRLSFVVEDADESRGRVTFDPILAFGRRIASVARVYTWPLERRAVDARGRHGTLHAKCVIVDGRELFLSSANFTEYAMSLNLELGVVVTSREVAQAAERMLERLVQEGVLIESR
jgi:phosphatidylserine/phosphatidylglycerophosphate/cardiolipin synthase-like enzyme